MKIFSTLVFTVLFITPLFSQSYDWGKVIASQTPWSTVSEVVTDEEGNVYFVGDFEGVFDIGVYFGGPSDIIDSGNGLEALIIKLDINGDLIWYRKIGNGTYAQGITCSFSEFDNSLYVGGNFSGVTVFGDWDMDSAEELNSNNGTGTAFIMKLSEDGVFNWVRQISVFNAFPIIATDNENGFVHLLINDVIGDDTEFNFAFNWGQTDNIFMPSSNFSILTTINADGSYMGTKVFSSFDPDAGLLYDGVFIGKMATAPGGRLIMFGRYLSPIDLCENFNCDSEIMEPIDVEDQVLFCFDYNTNELLWSRNLAYEETGFTSISVNESGNIALSGMFSNEFDVRTPFDGNSEILTPTSDLTSGFITVLNIDGEYQWTKVVGAEAGNSGYLRIVDLHIADDNKIYYRGRFGNTVNFGATFGISDIATSIDSENNFISSIDINQNYFFTIKTYTPSTQWAFTTDDLGGVIYGGIVTSDDLINIADGLGEDFVASYERTGYLVRFSDDNTTSIAENNENPGHTKIFPNPFHENINIESEKEVLQLDLLSTDGRIVHTAKRTTNLLLPDLTSGLFLLKITYVDGSTFTKKLLKQ